MNELLKHLSSENLPRLYWNENSQRTEYNHLIKYVYTMIKTAIDEGADRIQVSPSNFVWTREGKTIRNVDIIPPDIPEYPKDGYAGQLRRILDKDAVMKKWTRIVTDSDNNIVLDFLS